MKVVWSALLCGLMLEAGAAIKPLSAEQQEQVRAMQDKAAAYMFALQSANGSWMRNPAITSLALLGLMDTAAAKSPEGQPKIESALRYVAGCAQPNGTILDPRDRRSYPVYSTSICLLVLNRANRPEHQKIIRAARDYLLSVDPTPEDSDTQQPATQGFGYGKRHRADLNNTAWALEALAATDHLDREPLNHDPERAKKADLAWDKALTFLSSCQNLADTNQSAWIKSAPEEDRGGFIYCPQDAMRPDAQKEMLRSYGSMTYSGLKSLIYAKVKPEDVRVQAALSWIRKYYTLEENPGVGQAGYYYYLHTFSKTLAVMGLETLADAQGKEHDWRGEFIAAAARRQHPEGFWTNDQSNRWWESMPALSTSYVLMALDAIAR
ncbi:MAG: hypothetical protein IJJ33_17460 [Victivallales bacterium]|nr:hypothetical protein [Victivallales bacterium]